ncbi:type 1 glutamine amidotransferase domain-containing protein [Aureimonas psammosilenae]|uniref:type 1 glutamine amidotransferase domain-containing protein n=1 Tax=Aureimonas psammosilenae TaxID=2495496 RepID=UPI00126055E1|nr:type 1 glutamine amidotransferase domain-containing protein [Aureimonas psammosilenae]
MPKINEAKIAILATDGFEQVELTEPQKKLQEAGATVHVLSVKEGSIKGWDETDWGEAVKVDRLVTEAKVSDYDALVLPGGQINPDKLRTEKAAVAFVRDFFDTGKTVAAICHGPWLLIEAGIAKGRELTSFESIKTDVRNAGGNWVDREVVVDQGLVTSRKPDDLPAFIGKIIEEIEEGRHEDRRKAA